MALASGLILTVGVESRAQTSLDTSFGSTGKVTFNFGSIDAIATTLAVQPDGKILVAGRARMTASTDSWNFAIARLNRNGTLDSSFGANGGVITDFNGLNDGIAAIAIQADGRIVAGGYGSGASFALARYLPDGQLDTTFGVAGKVITTAGNNVVDVSGNGCTGVSLMGITALALQPDGQIVAIGAAVDWDGSIGDFAIARYNTDGSRDAALLANTEICPADSHPGVRVVDLGGQEQARALLLLPGGLMLIGGQSDLGSSIGVDSLLYRVQADGTPDPSYGFNGVVRLDTDNSQSLSATDAITSLARQPDGMIVAAVTTCLRTAGSQPSRSLVRVTASGALDSSFGTNGIVRGPDVSAVSSPQSLVLDAQGRILVAATLPYVSSPADLVVARYTSSGEVDATFNGTGWLSFDFLGDEDAVGRIALLSDGRVVVAGAAAAPNAAYSFAAAQLVTGPSQAATVDFDGDANGDALIYQPTNGQWARQQSTGSGSFDTVGGTWSAGFQIRAARFNDDAESDAFLFNPQTGQWFKMLGASTGFTIQASGTWWPGWQRYLADLDADGLTDVFLYDPPTGQWFKSTSTPTGFTCVQGTWSPGWEILPLSLNGDARADFFLFNGSSGQWFGAVSAETGGFTYPVSGFWSTAWRLTPGDFDGDGISDLLLLNPASGQWFVAFTTPSGFIYQSGWWSVGWVPYVVDWDGNGIADLFLHNPSNGQWFEMLSDGLGAFAVAGSGTWVTGFEITPTDFDGDRRSDLLLYSTTSGAWYQARNQALGAFVYTMGFWDAGLSITAGTLR